MVESLLLTATRVFTYARQQLLTNASGFFFARDDRLFLVTSRHVVIDEANGHAPDRLEIELHSDPDNMAISTMFSIPLYRDGAGVWRQGVDGGGQIDVAAVEIERAALPASIVHRAFTPAHLYGADDPPAWAYLTTPAAFERPKDPTAKQRVEGSARAYTLTEIADLFAPPDWFPAEHAAMPDPVGRGRRPGVQACASCHLPNGRGVPSSAMLAGLPADYITAQLNDFALGNRLPAIGKVGWRNHVTPRS